MSNRLEVEIGADIKELDAKVKAASNELKDFSTQTKVVDKNVKKVSTGFKGAGRSAGQAGIQIQQLVGQIQGGQSPLVAFSQQSADLGFVLGFPLVGAIVSVGAALAGTLIPLLLNSEKSAKELKAEQDKLADSLNDYVGALEAVSRANLKGEQSAQKELITLGNLRNVVSDTTISLQKRLGAIDELRKLYPQYFKDLSDEQILNGNLEKTYNTLTNSILARAKATAATNLIIKNSEKLLVLEEQLAAATRKRKEAEDLYNRIIKRNSQSDANYRGASADRTIRQNRAQNTYNKALEEENRLLGEKQNLELSNIDLEQSIDFAPTITDRSSNTVTTKVKGVFDDIKQEYNKGLVSFQTTINEAALNLTPATFEEQSFLFKERLQMFVNESNNILNSGLQQGVSNFASSIGNALASGGNVLQAAGAALLNSLGDILVRFGTLTIAYGFAAEALQKSFLNPFGGGIGAIVAGGALVAIGSAIKTFTSGVAGGGGGGSSSNVRGGQGSSARGGSVAPPSNVSSGGIGGGTVVFEIAGTKLVGVLNNTLRRNSNLGGSLTIAD